MRIDKFLYFVRLTKTRTLAQQIIAKGHVRLDGRPVPNGHVNVAQGQVVTVPIGGTVRVIQIDALPARRGPATEALAHYHDPQAKEPIDESDH